MIWSKNKFQYILPLLEEIRGILPKATPAKRSRIEAGIPLSKTLPSVSIHTTTLITVPRWIEDEAAAASQIQYALYYCYGYGYSGD